MRPEVALAVIPFIVGTPLLIWRDARRRHKRLLSSVRRRFGHPGDGKYRFSTLSSYWEHLPREEGDVDALTWDDLGMEDVLEQLDICQSLVGSSCLYAALHRPAGAETLVSRARLRGVMEDEEVRVPVQLALARLGKRTGTDLPGLLLESEQYQLENPRQYTLYALAPLAGFLLLPLSVQGGLLVMLAAFANNVYQYHRAQKQLETRLESVSYLVSMLRCAEELCKKLESSAPEYAANLRWALTEAGKVGLNTSLLGASPQSDLYMMTQLLGMFTLLPVVQYCRAILRIEQRREPLHEIYRLVGEAELAVCAASLCEWSAVWCEPEFSRGKLEIEVEDLVHPLLEQPVPNSAHITGGLLLTGSNASGKSTFLRALGVNLILGQTLGVCTARRMRMTPAPVLSSMAVSDNLSGGESYFVAEIRSMRRLVRWAEQGKAAYCFVDEILKGTNTAERVAAACAVLRYLRGTSCMCMAATHDLELASLLDGEYENHHFCEQVTKGKILFDYRLKDGPCTTRNAILLLEREGFPACILDQAAAMAAEFSPHSH